MDYSLTRQQRKLLNNLENGYVYTAIQILVLFDAGLSTLGELKNKGYVGRTKSTLKGKPFIFYRTNKKEPSPPKHFTVEGELFIPIKCTNSYLYISERGNVRYYNKKVRKCTTNISGTQYVSGNNQYSGYYHLRICVVVAEMFLQTPKKSRVKHIDGDRSNNHFKNLEYVSHISSAHLFEKRKGKNHWKYRPFEAEGDVYHTLQDASVGLGIPNLSTIRKRILSPHEKEYVFLDEK